MAAYQWKGEAALAPHWVLALVDAGIIRVSDDWAHVMVGDDEQALRPGDWIVKSEGGMLFVLDDHTYRGLLKAEADVKAKADAQAGPPRDPPPVPPLVEPDDENDENDDREEENEDEPEDYAALAKSLARQHEAAFLHEDYEPDPHNAAQEGADAPPLPVDHYQ